MLKQYLEIIEELEKRILALSHDAVLETKDCWDLLAIPGFNVTDLQPSFSQAAVAYGRAKRKIRKERGYEELLRDSPRNVPGGDR